MGLIKQLTSFHVLIILVFLSVLMIVLFLPTSSAYQKPIVNVQTIDTTQSVNVHFYTQKDKATDSLIQLYFQKKVSLDSLLQFINSKKIFPVSAYFEEIKYLNSTSDTIWYHLGKNYYTALGFISSSDEAQSLISSAARCFNKAIYLNPNNTNAKIMLASCYIQTPSPMLGIQMLKEIEKTDSNNILLQMQLAEFSVRSNQLDKAILRYQKALKLDSNKTEIYAYLSEIYLQKKDTLQSIRFLRKFAAKISDTALKNSIHQYIQSINK
ncbi:MAG: tetratricopeptide repeat protein [Bacteroidia bacterium]|nr:tetratricopeptide repeat protein [Bacteroidia bacterium]